MKIPKIAIHTQIVLALFFGVIFGTIFSVDTHKLKIEYLKLRVRYVFYLNKLR